MVLVKRRVLNEEWQKNWETFVRSIAAEFNSGLSNKELSDGFGNAIVRWAGTIREINTEAEYARGVAVDMPRVEVIVRQGYRFVADFVFAGVSNATAHSWMNARIGDKVEFESELRSGDAVFHGIEVSVFDPEKECHLKLMLANTTLVRHQT